MANSSITVTFVTSTSEDDPNSEENQVLSVELDDEKNTEVYGEGKSQFLYGEKAYFKVFRYPSTLSLTMTQSDGTLTNEGSGTSNELEDITFANTNEGSASKPVKSILSTEWLGNSLGAVSTIGTKVNTSRTGVGALKIGYTADFTRHAITVGTKDFDEYPVIVYISSGGSE